ncbi:MAG: class I SAM-dependent methyltransferase [Rhodospirillaceae bacterium]|jgi:ubiquinone/menaquinone biosynthesis C-methylase UbiE|nr:class I SAM-dependent methyltransferase [Rhodospirillaceae bacterium]
MEDQNQVGREHWKGRSSSWTATAAQGLSTDDTLNQMLIKLAGIVAGERVLDLGSGTGDPAISIGLALGGNGAITACDLTPEMLAKARDRSVNVGLDVISFTAADMTSLAFADNSFDCVTCRFGLMFPEDKVAAAREVLRVLKPGGRVGYIVWGPYDENPPFFVIRRAIAEAMGQEEGAVPHRHSLGQPGQLSEILNAAGFSKATEHEMRYKRPVDDLDDYINRALIRGYSETVDKLDDEGRDALMDTLRAAFEPYREDGLVMMPNYARLGLGWKPA